MKKLILILLFISVSSFAEDAYTITSFGDSSAFSETMFGEVNYVDSGDPYTDEYGIERGYKYANFNSDDNDNYDPDNSCDRQVDPDCSGISSRSDNNPSFKFSRRGISIEIPLRGGLPVNN